MKYPRTIHSFRNGKREEERAMRRCRTCGGIQYDWGCNFSTSKRGKVRWFIHWYCAGRGSCGRSDYEYMTYKRLCDLRQSPPVVKRAPNYPWCKVAA